MFCNRRGRLVAVLLAAGVAALSACTSGSDHPTAAPKSSSAAPTSASPSPTPKPTHKPTKKHKPKPKPKPKPPAVNPLTGVGPVPKGPVIGVKVDNTSAAYPQIGLGYADVVYVEQVEGGLTRLLAVFASHRPSQVGPVRSVRNSDPTLLKQYGRPALAFSGGASAVVNHFDQSGLVNASYNSFPSAYSRAGDRPNPYNLIGNLQAISGDLHKATGVKDIGMRWAAKDPDQVQKSPTVHGLTATIGGTPVSFRWGTTLHRWIRTVDGADLKTSSGALVSTPNVIVQMCQVTVDRGDIDAAGNPSADTKTVGNGAAYVFRDGHMLRGHWTRPNAAAPTLFRSKYGKDLLLHPGGTWVLLVGNGHGLSTH